ncbi:MAG: TetR/AcrR family transcriptional regulator [Planctomycetes bacterium]|nr:TetR/AcrR family transcriptional regulator [Planctomycetota bacterium]
MAVARQPQQTRSRQTLERILDGTEQLLRKKPFEEITVAEIVRAAGSSVGSFYARFGSKEGLLPLLYQRYDREVQRRVDRWFRRSDYSELSLAELVRRFVDTTVRSFRRRVWLVRAAALYVRSHPDVVTREMQERRTEMHKRIARMFEHRYGEIRHPDPARAVQMGMFFVGAACRDVIVIAGPHARATKVSDEELKTELARMFLRYLGAGASTTGSRKC